MQQTKVSARLLQLKSGNLTAITPNGLYSKNKSHVPEVTQSRNVAVLSAPLSHSFCSKCLLTLDRHKQAATPAVCTA
jgi:ABC-type metal ion transport system substrate-binding protein